jgi:hypothetical protein
MQQSFGNLIFEKFLPPFKINYMVWFRHEIPNLMQEMIKERALFWAWS